MMTAEAKFISDALSLADTGAFRDVAELESALRQLWPEEAISWLQADDLAACLSQRCRRAAA